MTISLQVLFQLFSNFEEFSSLKVNLDKCEACWIGASKFNTDTPLGCSWVSLTNGSIRVLGNFISYNDLIAHQLNFLNIIPTVKDLLGIWKQRNLTIAGKIQVFKSLIFSKLVYVATMNTVPKTITDQLQVIHKDFIWRGKKVRIKHSTLIGEYADGGLRDLDISSSLTSVKISWIRRLFDNNFHPWKILAKRLLRKVGGLYIFHFDLKLSEQSLYDVKRLPSFYKDVVLLWEKYSNLLVQRKVNKKTVFSQALFNNKNLLIRGESIWHKLLYSQGMRIIGDLYDNEGSIKTWSVLSAEYYLGPESFLSCYS